MLGKNKILIVESYLAGATVFASILKRNGFSADVAQTCKEAMQKTYTTDYAIVLIDEEIPDKELILQQLAKTKTAKIVITDFPQEAMLNGADACLRKVIKPEEFLSVVKRYVESYPEPSKI